MQRVNRLRQWRYIPLPCLILLLICAFNFDRANAQVVGQARLYAADGNQFGNAMAASGSMLVVGDSEWVRNPDRNPVGAAYVFTLTNGQWKQGAQLTASDRAPFDDFGSSIAINGSTLIIGAPGKNGIGAVYMFALSGGHWTQQQEITPADGQVGDQFGTAVTLSGTTLAVGATGRAGGNGAVYTYTFAKGKWSPQAELPAPAPNPDFPTFFGFALSLSTSTLAVGAPYANEGDGAAYLYTFSKGKWTEKAPFDGDSDSGAELGYSLAMSATTLILGAPGESAAFSYTSGKSGWSPQATFAPFEGSDEITDFGQAIAFSGNTLVISALNADDRAVYVFTFGKNGWAPTAECTPYDDLEQTDTQFGTAVTIVGTTVVASRPAAWPVGISPYSPLGAVYSFTLGGAATTASDGQWGDNFGAATALFGNTVLCGAPGSNGLLGAVYVYTRNQGVLTQKTLLIAADGQVGDGYGSALAFDGTTLAVGAPYANNGMGAVYIYKTGASGWNLKAELTASDGQFGDLFGNALALSQSTLLIGAQGHNNGQGAAYLFTSNGKTWNPQAELAAADGQVGDGFGTGVGIDGSNLVVGSPSATTSVAVLAGAAYVFALNGGQWSQSVKLAAADGQVGDGFGSTSAISGGVIAIGKPYGGGGAVCLYSLGSFGWALQAEMIDGSGAFDGFGVALALSGNTLAVGAYGHDDGLGKVYVFTQVGENWTLANALNAALGQEFDSFGGSVALSGANLAVGAPYANYGAGALYAY